MIKNHLHRLNLKDRQLGKPLKRHNPAPQTKSFLKVPLGWNFLVLRKSSSNQTNVYLYQNAYFLNFTIPPYTVNRMYDRQTSSFSLTHPHTSYCYEAYLRGLADLFSRFDQPALFKIRFKGKGYYMYKNRRNTIAPQFGYAHRVYVYAHATTVKFLSKTKILLFGLSKQDVVGAGHRLRAVKPINIFTGRGVRFARQVIYKKTGKVSSYR